MQVCDLSKPGAEGHPHRSESEMGGWMSLDLIPHLLRCGVADIYVMLSLASHLLYKTILFETEGNFALLFTLEQRTDSLLLGIVDPKCGFRGVIDERKKRRKRCCQKIIMSNGSAGREPCHMNMERRVQDPSLSGSREETVHSCSLTFTRTLWYLCTPTSHIKNKQQNKTG